MGKERLEAFTDGVIAIIITIMVLELKVPDGTSFDGMISAMPIFLVYALSYANVGIFWNNHHHMLHLATRVDGMVLWANLFLLFWISLVPFTIRWMDETHFGAMPTAAYGAVLFMAAIGYSLLKSRIIICNGPNSPLAAATGRDRKGNVSIVLYLIAIPLAFVSVWLSILLYVGVAMMWFVPDRRIESIV